MESLSKESSQEMDTSKAKISHLEKVNERLKEEVVSFGKLISDKTEGTELKGEVERLMNAVNEQLKQKNEEVCDVY